MSYSEILNYWKKREGYASIPQLETDVEESTEGEASTYGDDVLRDVEVDAKQSSAIRKWTIIGSVLLLIALGAMAVMRNVQSGEMLGKSPRYAPCHTHCSNPCAVHFDKRGRKLCCDWEPSPYRHREPTCPMHIDKATKECVCTNELLHSKSTKNPTHYPTKKPSSHPTTKPTRHPTMHPTLKPSRNPSFKPTNIPTQKPQREYTIPIPDKVDVDVNVEVPDVKVPPAKEVLPKVDDLLHRAIDRVSPPTSPKTHKPQPVEPHPQPEPAAPVPEPQPEPSAPVVEPSAPVDPQPQPEPAAPVPEPQPEPSAPVVEPSAPVDPQPQPEPAAPVPEPQPEPTAPAVEPAPVVEPTHPVSVPQPEPQRESEPEPHPDARLEGQQRGPGDAIVIPVPEFHMPEPVEAESTAAAEPVTQPEAQPEVANQPESVSPVQLLG